MIIHHDLQEALERVYKPSSLVCEDIIQEKESQEYGACTFTLHNKRIVFRIAKITPTKNGFFVTLWKRNVGGPIEPYDVSDPGDLFMISVRRGNHFGNFVFPKSVLYEHGVLSQSGAGGKRGIRVYPPWDKVESLQARNTQKWQHNYFFEINPDTAIDKTQVLRLFM